MPLAKSMLAHSPRLCSLLCSSSLCYHLLHPSLVEILPRARVYSSVFHSSHSTTLRPGSIILPETCYCPCCPSYGENLTPLVAGAPSLPSNLFLKLFTVYPSLSAPMHSCYIPCGPFPTFTTLSLPFPLGATPIAPRACAYDTIHIPPRCGPASEYSQQHATALAPQAVEQALSSPVAGAPART